MNNAKQRLIAISSGVITSALIYYIIPRFFMRGIPDVIWVILMLLLPTLIAAVLYQTAKLPPRSVLWSFLTEAVIAVVLHKPIGAFLGYRLESLSWDLFEFIAYLMFTLGFAVLASLAQFSVLYLLRKRKNNSAS